jgi:alkanesulfonate monooxygenase SsuD/methylene tetrahydromethanopterin reductase-like flavin-dependent oxidoreductase (luciferase family)
MPTLPSKGSPEATHPFRSIAPMPSGLFVPIFDQLANPALVARLSAEAEDAGWNGFFVWDHVRWREPILEVADAWITLAAIAAATRAIRLGPMVTPLARRRPVKVARETVTLDRLSDGRLTLGVGLGSDRSGNELSITGEELDDRRRARMLDEALEILTAAWSGEPVHHRGEHYTVDGMRFLPRPVSGRGFRYGWADTPTLRKEIGRDVTDPFDVVAALPPGTDPAPYTSAGATWWMVEFPWDEGRWTRFAA